ncbi:hypothetical protein ACNOYE_14250 [Nannocystaceae bacterium ST9]
MATTAASLLDAEIFSASSSRDALGRVLTAAANSYTYDAAYRLGRELGSADLTATAQPMTGWTPYDEFGVHPLATSAPGVGATRKDSAPHVSPVTGDWQSRCKRTPDQPCHRFAQDAK